MSEILIQQLIAFPTRAPSSTDLWRAFPERLHELTSEDADYLTQALTESMDKLAAIMVEEAGGSVVARQMKELLVDPFIYAFDKGVEMVYKLRVDSDVPVEFNLEDIDGTAGDNVAGEMQFKVTSAIPIVTMIFGETIDFADQEATTILDIEELFKSILTGGMFLGVEFCLRQELTGGSTNN